MAKTKAGATRLRLTPSFSSLQSASAEASGKASRSSQKMGTRCELRLREGVEGRKLSFRTNCATPPPPYSAFQMSCSKMRNSQSLSTVTSARTRSGSSSDATTPRPQQRLLDKKS